MYLPTPLFESITARMKVSLHRGTPYVPCHLRLSEEAIEFGLGDGRGGPRITVPYAEIIYPYGFPANMGGVEAKDGTPLCYLGLIGTDGPIYLLGDTFIRSAYVVYDVDNRQVSMASVKPNRCRKANAYNVQS